jgi:RNA polymerase sigma-70 factor, ECF subfamily
MVPTDTELMLAVREGDVERFGVLFDRHHQRIYEFFYRLGGNAAVSEDLVQEVFLRMLKYRHTFRADSEFRGWMYHIARTVRIDRFRSQREETPLLEGDVENARGRSVPGPDDSIEEMERAELLQRALLRLPEDKRELLILARFQELKYEQIGSLLNIDAGAVKVRVHRAMTELREIVQKLSDERSKCNVKKPGKLLRTS